MNLNSSLKDVVVPAQSVLPCTHIHNQGGYSGFLFRPSTLTNELSLFLYDAGAEHTAILPLPVPAIFSVISSSLDIGFSGNRLLVAGVGSVNGVMMIYEFELGSQTPLPSSITLVNSFTAGPGGFTCCVTELSNGGIAAFFAMGTPDSRVQFVYRLPDGIYSMGGGILWGMSLDTTNLTAAELPGQNSVWVFLNKDSSGWLSAGRFLISPDGLQFGQTSKLVDGTEPVLALRPYGEICGPEAITDWSKARILLLYNNNGVIRSVNPDGWITKLTLGSFDGVSLSFLMETDLYVNREASGFGVSQVGGSISMSYCESNINNMSVFGIFPFYQQTVGSPPILQGQSGFIEPLMFNAHRNDHLLRYPDLAFHLLVETEKHHIQPHESATT